MERVVNSITNQWWLLILQGALAILFGVIAWVWPGLTVLTLVVLFAVFAIVGGVANLFAATEARRAGHSPWAFLFQGVLGIATGIVVSVWPGISALALLYVIAVWALIIGVYQVVVAIELRKAIDNEWFLGIAGVASIAFGLLAAIFPGAGALALIWTIGVYAIFFGVLLIALGVRLHGEGRHLTSPASS